MQVYLSVKWSAVTDCMQLNSGSDRETEVFTMRQVQHKVDGMFA